MKNKKPSFVSLMIDQLLQDVSINSKLFNERFPNISLPNILNRIRSQGYELQENEKGVYSFSPETIDKAERGEINNG